MCMYVQVWIYNIYVIFHYTQRYLVLGLKPNRRAVRVVSWSTFSLIETAGQSILLFCSQMNHT